MTTTRFVIIRTSGEIEDILEFKGEWTRESLLDHLRAEQAKVDAGRILPNGHQYLFVWGGAFLGYDNAEFTWHTDILP